MLLLNFFIMLFYVLDFFDEIIFDLHPMFDVEEKNIFKKTMANDATNENDIGENTIVAVLRL